MIDARIKNLHYNSSQKNDTELLRINGYGNKNHIGLFFERFASVSCPAGAFCQCTFHFET
jgi:hypothetical protein